jgi:hypothetical protein
MRHQSDARMRTPNVRARKLRVFSCVVVTVECADAAVRARRSRRCSHRIGDDCALIIGGNVAWSDDDDGAIDLFRLRTATCRFVHARHVNTPRIPPLRHDDVGDATATQTANSSNSTLPARPAVSTTT